MKKVKLVIFDAEGIIYISDKVYEKFEPIYKQFLKRFGMKETTEKKLWKKMEKKILKGEMSLKQYLFLVSKKYGIPKIEVMKIYSKYKELFYDYSKPMKDIVKIMKHLKSEGIKVAILSNSPQPPKWRIEIFKKLGIIKGVHYDKYFMSNKIGYMKPEKKSYLVVLKYFDSKPSESVFVGHDDKEIDGARLVGIHTIKLRKRRKPISLKTFLSKLNE